MIYAFILFVAGSVLMLTFSKYRPYIALGAALIFIVSGMLPLEQILPSIDLNVLLMIAGTMGPVALFIGSRILQPCRARPPSLAIPPPSCWVLRWI